MEILLVRFQDGLGWLGLIRLGLKSKNKKIDTICIEFNKILIDPSDITSNINPKITSSNLIQTFHMHQHENINEIIINVQSYNFIYIEISNDISLEAQKIQARTC